MVAGWSPSVSIEFYSSEDIHTGGDLAGIFVASKPAELGPERLSKAARRTKLSMRKIGALQALERPYAVWDSALPSFGVYVAASGRKTFIAQTRIRGISRRTTLGLYPDNHIDAIRGAARLWLLEAEKRQRPLNPRPTPLPAVTLQALAEDYCANQADRWAPLTLETSLGALRRSIYPTLGGVDVANLTAADVERWFDGLAQSPGSANRAAPVLSAIMKYAEQKGLRTPGSNPCRRLKRYKRRPMERFLSPGELRRVGRRLAEVEAEQPEFAAAIRLLVLTGMRASEVLSLTFGGVQGSRAFLPKSKTGPRTIYLCQAACSLIEGLKPSATSEWVISTGRRAMSYSWLSSHWAVFREEVELSDVRLHDLRHTYASVAAGQGIGLSFVGGLLGHVLPESTMRYTHFADDVTRAAVDRVSARLASLSAGEGAAA
jgi:integrase